MINTVPVCVCVGLVQKVMQNPCLAADGYSYEHDAIVMWLCDQNTSPVTKAQLRDKKLVPNLSLMSAIASWMAQGGRPYLME